MQNMNYLEVAQHLGVLNFSCHTVVQSPQAGARRYFVEQICPVSGESRKRSCVETVDGDRRYEVPMRVENKEALLSMR